MSRSRASFLPALAAAGLLWAGWATGAGAQAPAPHPGPIRVIDDAGQHITLSGRATRIVAIEPSNSEIVLDLGLKARLVGVDQSSFQYTPAPWKGRLAGVHSIGNSYPAVSEEAIVAVHPDLVLAATGVNGLGGLHALHIPVVILDPQSIGGIYHDIRLVGRLTGTLPRAGQLVRHMRARIAAITAQVRQQAHHRPTVFYDLGGLYTAGPKSFIDSLIRLAGGVNVADRLSRSAYPHLSAEQVVAANPDLIIVDPGATTVAKEDQLPGFSAIRAVRRRHVFALPNSAYVNEPSMALVPGLKELVRIFHPHVKP